MSIDQEVRSLLGRYFETVADRLVGCEVPKYMQVRPAEHSSDWHYWKVVPFESGTPDFSALELKCRGPLPPPFRAFMSYGRFMPHERGGIRLPGTHRRNPLADLEESIEAQKELMLAQFVAFGSDGNDVGPLCFDYGSRLANGDCPVVLFDHELLFDWCNAGNPTRESAMELAIPFADSASQLLEAAFAEGRLPRNGPYWEDPRSPQAAMVDEALTAIAMR